MSLRVNLDINGSVIDRLIITQKGTPDGSPVPKDGSGPRLYHWQAQGASGTLIHNREDGAAVLASRALLALVEFRKRFH